MMAALPPDPLDDPWPPPDPGWSDDPLDPSQDPWAQDDPFGHGLAWDEPWDVDPGPHRKLDPYGATGMGWDADPLRPQTQEPWTDGLPPRDPTGGHIHDTSRDPGASDPGSDPMAHDERGLASYDDIDRAPADNQSDMLDAVERDVEIDGGYGDMLDDVELDSEGGYGEDDVLDAVERAVEEDQEAPPAMDTGPGDEPSPLNDRTRAKADGDDKRPGHRRSSRGPQRDSRRPEEPFVRRDRHRRTEDYAWPDWARRWANTHRPGGSRGSSAKRTGEQDARIFYCKLGSRTIDLAECSDCGGYEPEDEGQGERACRHLIVWSPTEKGPRTETEDETEPAPEESRIRPLLDYCNLHEQEITDITVCHRCPDRRIIDETSCCLHADCRPDPRDPDDLHKDD